MPGVGCFSSPVAYFLRSSKCPLFGSTTPPTPITTTQHQMYIGPWQDYLMLRRHRLARSDEISQRIIQPPTQFGRPLPIYPLHNSHTTLIYTPSLSMQSDKQPAKTLVFAGKRKAHGGKRKYSHSTATPARQRLNTVAKMRNAWLSREEIEGAERENIDGDIQSVERAHCSDDAAYLGQGEGELAEKEGDREASMSTIQICDKSFQRGKEEEDLMEWVQGLELSDAEDG